MKTILVSLSLVLAIPAQAGSPRRSGDAAAGGSRASSAKSAHPAFAKAVTWLDFLERRTGVISPDRLQEVHDDLQAGVQTSGAKRVPVELTGRLRGVAERSLQNWLTSARSRGPVKPSDSMAAQAAAELYAFVRTLEPQAARPSAALRAFEPEIHALMNEVIDARVSVLEQLRVQAKQGDAASAVDQARLQAISLEMDAKAFARAGFATKKVDHQALLDAVELAAARP